MDECQTRVCPECGNSHGSRSNGFRRVRRSDASAATSGTGRTHASFNCSRRPALQSRTSSASLRTSSFSSAENCARTELTNSSNPPLNVEWSYVVVVGFDATNIGPTPLSFFAATVKSRAKRATRPIARRPTRTPLRSAWGHFVANRSEQEPAGFANPVGLPRGHIAAVVVEEMPVVSDLVGNLPVSGRQLRLADRRSRRDVAARRYRRPGRRTCTGAGALRGAVGRPEVQRVSVGPDLEDSLRTLGEADGETRWRRRTDARQFVPQIARSTWSRRRRDGRGDRRGGCCR